MHFILIPALFTIAKIWKQPKHPSRTEWIKRLCVCVCVCVCVYVYIYIQTMEYYSAIEGTPAICHSMDGPLGYYPR